MQALFCRYPNSAGVKHVEMMMVIDIDFLGAFAQNAIQTMKDYDESSISDRFEFRAYWYFGGTRKEGDLVDLQNDDHVFYKCSGEHFNKTSAEKLAKEFMESHKKWIDEENARRKKFRELYEKNEKKGVMTINSCEFNKKTQLYTLNIWYKGTIREIPITAEQLLNGEINWDPMTKKEAMELRKVTINGWQQKEPDLNFWNEGVDRFEKKYPNIVPILNEEKVTPFDKD